MTTVVEFRTGVDDKLAYAVRWLRLAAARGARARVIGPSELLQALDRALWVDLPGDFVPHAWARQAGRTPGLDRTPLWLGDGALGAPEPGLLLNLGAEIPAELAPYERVIEIVATDPADAQAGRRRWKTYVERGLAPAHRKAEA